MKERNLTQRQENFALAYIETGNASEAYRRAYPASRKWTAKAVHTRASMLFGFAEVLRRIEELRAKAECEAIATRRETLIALTRILRACPSDIIDENGSIDLRKVREMRQELAGIEIEDTPNGRKYKVKFKDGIAAIDRLAKLEGWDAPQKVEMWGLAELVEELDRRGRGEV